MHLAVHWLWEVVVGSGDQWTLLSGGEMGSGDYDKQSVSLSQHMRSLLRALS